MVRMQDIVDAINVLMVKKFPKATAYINTCPKDFRRPSYLIQNTYVYREDASRSTVFVTADFIITYFVETDSRYIMNIEKLRQAQADILDLFSCGYITVDDRRLKVTGSEGETTLTDTSVDLQVSYFDDRDEPAEPLPAAEKVYTTILLEWGK